MLAAASVLLMPPLLLEAAVGFIPCPTTCLCYDSTDLVDCRARGLVRVPHNVPQDSWLLDLRGNKLRGLHSRSFLRLWSLKILLMSNNSIRTLQPLSLSSLQFLEQLDLGSNQLRRLPPDFSLGLASVQDLRLDHNLLRHLDSSSLARFENLHKLDLSYNRIRTVDAAAFRGLSLLWSLNLEGNELRVLQDGVLSRQQRLGVLLLGRNNISHIQSGALAPLLTLALLDLRGNRLGSIGFGTFRMLQTTGTDLQMSHNPWRCDCELQRVFAKLRHLQHLHMGDYQELVCATPAALTSSPLEALEGRLCAGETASLLLVICTTLLTVAGILVQAGLNHKKSQSGGDSDSQRGEE